MLVSSLRSVSMSRTCGMFSRMISSSVRMAAAMQGRAEFLAPETLMVPRRGLPPRTTNLSIMRVYGDSAWKWVAWLVLGAVVRCWVSGFGYQVSGTHTPYLGLQSIRKMRFRFGLDWLSGVSIIRLNRKSPGFGRGSFCSLVLLYRVRGN